MAPPPPVERPVTPSLRSSSRQSFASSVSRQSHRSSLAGGGGEDASELRHLLDASERLGREMEDRLVEKSRRIKELEDAALERERRFEDRVRQLESEAEASQRQADQNRLEAEQRQHEASRSADSRQANERKHLAKEAEIESLRERLARANDDHARVAGDLQAEVDKLRKAGQALCETYEDKIAEIELARLEALDLVDELRRDRPPPLLEPAAEPKAAAAAVGGGAAAIDAENARAEVEHLRAKVATLEEQLEDVRAQLEQEIADARVRRHKAIEAETSLKDQIRAVQAETGECARLCGVVSSTLTGALVLACRLDETRTRPARVARSRTRSRTVGIASDARSRAVRTRNPPRGLSRWRGVDGGQSRFGPIGTRSGATDGPRRPVTRGPPSSRPIFIVSRCRSSVWIAG